MKNKKICVFGAVFIIFLMVTNAGAIPAEDWENNYLSNNVESGVCVDQTIDNGYVIAATRSDEDNNNYVVIMKTDSDGNKLWSKSFGEGVVKKIISTEDGGSISLVLKMPSGSQNSIESRLIKLNSAGSKADCIFKP